MKFITVFIEKIGKHSHFFLFIFFGLYFFLTSKSVCQSVYVPLNHWVYDYVDRLETKRIIKNSLTGTKPLTRHQIARFIFAIHEKLAQGFKLNHVEVEQLNFLKIEFNEELAEHKLDNDNHQNRILWLREQKLYKKCIPAFIYHNGKNLITWQHEHYQVYIDPILYRSLEYSNPDTLQDTEKIFQFSNGVRIYGYLGDRLGFFIDARDNKEWGTKKYKIGNYTLPGLGFVRATSPDFIYHDETDAYLSLGFNHINLTYGKFKNYWGPGYTGSLILSDNATSYDQFKLEINYKKFSFTSIYAFLIDYKDYELDSLQQRKYLAGHRIEFTPWDWLSLGLSEVVLFKGRSFEPSYVNPFMFFRSAEHYLGSPDNMMMGVDFTFFPFKNIKMYGEFMIDDITTSKLGTNWFGNKFGLLAGIFFAEPMTLDNFDIKMEYVRLKPYMYTHENSLEYTHYGTSLGYDFKPNSEAFALLFDYQFTMRMKLSGYYHYLRHGSNTADTNVGGDIERHFVDGDNIYPEFLGGELEKKHIVGADFSYEIIRHLFMNMRYKYDSYYRQKRNCTSHSFHFSMGINY